ncbi:MAG: tetratricopeptide repeat protein [Flavobacteriales bacterium]|nr:tetratricopeptide repeat protein [Flavobacteriales bacterium]
MPKQSASKREQVAERTAQNDPDLERALYLVNSGSNPMEGITLLRQMVEEDSTNVEAQLWLGRFSIQSNQLDKALNRFKTVTRIQPQYADGWWELAMLQWDMQDHQDALVSFETTYALDSTFQNALFFMGQCYEKSGDSAAALDAYERLLPRSEDPAVTKWLEQQINELRNT